MPWEYKNEYDISLINANVITPNRFLEVDWPDKVASFFLEVTPLTTNAATLPTDEPAFVREVRYNVYVQGRHDGSVFWAHYGVYKKTRIVIPQEVGEMLWSIREELDKGVTLLPPRIRVIVPTNHKIVLRSTRLGYKH